MNENGLCLPDLAHSVVRQAVYRGWLPRLDGSVPCVDCGNPAEHYEHRDYAKPLDVEPVCQGCNVRRGPAENKLPVSSEAASVGDRIRWQREAAGISQKELAREAGVSHGWLSELETGTAATLDLLSPVNQALRKRLFGKIRECLDVLEW